MTENNRVILVTLLVIAVLALALFAAIADLRADLDRVIYTAEMTHEIMSQLSIDGRHATAEMMKLEIALMKLGHEMMTAR